MFIIQIEALLRYTLHQAIIPPLSLLSSVPRVGTCFTNAQVKLQSPLAKRRVVYRRECYRQKE